MTRGLALQNDGKIVIAGAYGTYDNILSRNKRRAFGVARFCPDGLPDNGINCVSPEIASGFGDNGNGRGVEIKFKDKDSEAMGVAIQKDGKIVLAGYQSNFVALRDAEVALARLCPDGSLDDGSCGQTFGKNGMITSAFIDIDNRAGSVANAVAIDRNCSIVVVGSATGRGGYRRFLVARYLSGLEGDDCAGGWSVDGGQRILVPEPEPPVPNPNPDLWGLNTLGETVSYWWKTFLSWF